MNNLERRFALNLFKANYVKLVEDRPALSPRRMSATKM